MTKITDIMLRNSAPGGARICDSMVTGLGFTPGTEKGRGKWNLIFVSPETRKRREFGLGTYPTVGVADARERALEARRLIALGKDPVEQKRLTTAAATAAASTLTFEQAARSYIDASQEGWRNAKHKAQWKSTLETYVFPKIGKIKVTDLQSNDFAGVLKPIWLKKPETASRIKQRCYKVMKWCRAQGLVANNPVDVLDDLLPKQPGKRERVKHHPSMPWRDIPAFMQKITRMAKPTSTVSLLEFVILTAARSGEARAMRWEEVDFNKSVWTVPAERMKAKVLHRVPLSTRALEILERQRAHHPESDLVFPALRGGELTDMALTKFLRDHKAPSGDIGRTATAHGFRSSFRDWCSEGGIARDLAERALAHTIKNQAEAAYHRTDLLEQRRPVMEDWATYVSGHAASDKVITLKNAHNKFG